MRALHQVAANEIAVIPYYLKGYQQHGLQYRINEYERAEPLGAQCANCHTIVWITGRSDPILNEKLPEYAVNGGPVYREYYQNKLKRFLRSLPACPHCHQQAYDLFITNITLKRFEDGSPFPNEFHGIDEEMSSQVKDKAVWWYGDEAEAKRLNLQFL